MTTVEFSSSSLLVAESDGSVIVPLVLLGQAQSSFIVIVIAEAYSSLSTPATGM